MRKVFVATLCALALAAVVPAQADTRLPLNLAEKAAFCGIETSLGVVGDVIEHQGCAATQGSYDFDMDITNLGGTNVFGTVYLDNLVLDIDLVEDTTKGQIWEVTQNGSGDFDNVGIDDDSVRGYCSNTTFGEIIIGGGLLKIHHTKFDWMFIKDLYNKKMKVRGCDKPKCMVITDKGLEVITKLGYPRAKYRQISKYVRPNGGDGVIWIKKKRITPTSNDPSGQPSQAPSCTIEMLNLDVDNFGEGLQVDGRLRVN